MTTCCLIGFWTTEYFSFYIIGYQNHLVHRFTPNRPRRSSPREHFVVGTTDVVDVSTVQNYPLLGKGSSAYTNNRSKLRSSRQLKSRSPKKRPTTDLRQESRNGVLWRYFVECYTVDRRDTRSPRSILCPTGLFKVKIHLLFGKKFKINTGNIVNLALIWFSHKNK